MSQMYGVWIDTSSYNNEKMPPAWLEGDTGVWQGDEVAATTTAREFGVMLGIPCTAELLPSDNETFAANHCDQYLGCATCKESHHTDSFCSCGRCFHQYIGTKRCTNDEVGTFVYCECGKSHMWD